jgi:hypothetical protein
METKQWHIPLSRLPLYAGIVAFLPLVLSVYFHFSKLEKWNEISAALQQVQVNAKTKSAKQAINSLVRKQFALSDPSYIEEKIEKITCLRKEKEALEKLFESPSFRGNEQAARRYSFITGENLLRFSETTTQVFDDVCETHLSLAQPIEVDNEDIKAILSHVEQRHPKQPLLLIKDFSLNRSKTSLESEVYLLSMTLLKREFSS